MSYEFFKRFLDDFTFIVTDIPKDVCSGEEVTTDR